MTDTTTDDGLNIPAFLRAIPGKRRRIRDGRVPYFKFHAPTPPDDERFAGAVFMHVYLYDEMPKLGCGYQGVWVKEQRKWVRVASRDGVILAKCLKAVWNEVIAAPKKKAKAKVTS